MSKLTEHMIAALESAVYRAYDAGRIDGEHVRTGWQILGKIPAATRKAMHTRGLMCGHYYLTQEGVKARESVMPSESVQKVSAPESVDGVPVSVMARNNQTGEVIEYAYVPNGDSKRVQEFGNDAKSVPHFSNVHTVAHLMDAATRRAEGVARIVEKVRETATRKADSTPESDWHIFTGKEWMSIRYAGMPVNHWDGTTWYPVVYRHRVEECNSASCDFHPGSVVTAPLATSVIKIGALIGVVTGRTAENGTLFEFTVSGGEYPKMWTAIVGPWAYVAKAEVPAPVVEREKFRITEYRDCMGEEQVHRTGCADIERARRMGRVLNGAECIYDHEIESILEFGIDYWGDIATDTTEDGSPEWEAECISLAEGMHWHNCTRGMNIPTR